MQMADNALKAKQRAAEKLAKQLEALNQQGPNATLLKRVGGGSKGCHGARLKSKQ
jgi:hypothetical protein